jgi:hypothetical protein
VNAARLADGVSKPISAKAMRQLLMSLDSNSTVRPALDRTKSLGMSFVVVQEIIFEPNVARPQDKE